MNIYDEKVLSLQEALKEYEKLPLWQRKNRNIETSFEQY